MGTVFLCCNGCSPQEERARRFPRHAPRHWQETTVKTGPKGGAPDLRRKCTGNAPDLHLYKSRDACYHYNRAERGARGRRSSRRITHTEYGMTLRRPAVSLWGDAGDDRSPPPRGGDGRTRGRCGVPFSWAERDGRKEENDDQTGEGIPGRGGHAGWRST